MLTTNLFISTAGLTPNTNISFRVRAVNHRGVPSGYALSVETATLVTAPAFTQFTGLTMLAVYGGVDYEKQRNALRGNIFFSRCATRCGWSRSGLHLLKRLPIREHAEKGTSAWATHQNTMDTIVNRRLYPVTMISRSISAGELIDYSQINAYRLISWPGSTLNSKINPNTFPYSKN